MKNWHPTSWQDIFKESRQNLFDRMTWLPCPIEATGHYLEQLERAIFTIWRPGEQMPPIETLPYGILLGDVMVQRFGARWHYGDFTTGRITGDQILDHEVRLDDRKGGVFSGKPMLRIGKFVRDPSKSLTSWYDFFEAVASGNLDFERLAQEGFIETSLESVAWVKAHQDHGQANAD